MRVGIDERQISGARGDNLVDSDEKYLIERYITAYNAFDVEGMVECLSPDVRFENYSDGQLTSEASGIEEFRQLAQRATELFSEREQGITSMEAGANSVLVHIAYRGVLARDVPGGPSAGTSLDLQGHSEFMFSAGKIVKIIDRS